MRTPHPCEGRGAVVSQEPRAGAGLGQGPAVTGHAGEWHELFLLCRQGNSVHQGSRWTMLLLLNNTPLPDLQNPVSRMHKWILLIRIKWHKDVSNHVINLEWKAKKAQVPEWLMPHYLCMWQIETWKEMCLLFKEAQVKVPSVSITLPSSLPSSLP